MRRCLALLLAVAVASAEDDKELEKAVSVLVRDLGHADAQVRSLALFRLAAYGDRIRSLLERVASDDPEVRRAIRFLVRAGGKVEIELLPLAENAIPIGAALTLEVRIVNNTEETLQILPDAERRGLAGPFRIRVGDRTVAAVGFDQVNWGEQIPTILPGGTRRFLLNLGRANSPLRRPALYDVSVIFDGKVARGDPPARAEEGEENVLQNTEPLVLESAPIRVHVLGSKADDLDRALGSDDARAREAAAKELSMRDDEAVVPILRRRAHERPLRLAAIRRLGALGAEQDFNLIYEATRDESADVRRAAVLGLGKYGGAAVPAALATKARSRLLLLASDQELQAAAIQALEGHKHVSTVECFVKLLGSGRLAAPSIQAIRRTLLEWTGLAVDERPSEIRAFLGWWEANRQSWATENASGR